MNNIATLLHKEWLEFKQQRMLMLGIVALPLLLPSIIAAYSIVGEKTNRTLEPLLGVIAIAAMVAISARVNDPRTAQQLSAWVVLPFLLFFFGQVTGLIVLGPLAALGAALALGLLAAAAVWAATRLFQREVILTKWT